jgi:microcystin-dependent protein
MKQRLLGIFGVAAVLFFLVISFSQAGVPGVITYKGELLDAGGQPVTGTNSIDFKLYSVESGGTAYWSETQTVSVATGSFTVQLGANPANLIDDSQLGGDTWLGITVAGGTEMTPRQKMSSVAYSLRAKVAESVTNSDSLIPAGSIMAYAGTTAPAGWMFCEGTSLDRTTYSRLFAAIGTSHGSSSPTTFNIPDYRGRFLRGVDRGAGLDKNTSTREPAAAGGNSGDAVGSVEDGATMRPAVGFTGTMTGSGTATTSDQIPSVHSHAAIAGTFLVLGGSNPTFTIAPGGGVSSSSLTDTAGSHNHSMTTNVTGTSAVTGGGDLETRPVNANVEYIIKY